MKPEDIVRQELIGSEVRVVRSSDPKKVGLFGHVVDETKQMIVIEYRGKERMVAKKECTFKFTTPYGVFSIDGMLLVGRPEERLKMKLPHKWK